MTKDNCGSLCGGNGICPYIPCRRFPKCNHLQEQLDFARSYDGETLRVTLP